MNPFKIVFFGIVTFFGIISLLTSFGVVDAGERGVKLHLGEVVGTIEPGFHSLTSNL